MRGNAHVRFGGRAAETASRKREYCAAARPLHQTARPAQGQHYALLAMIDTFSRYAVGWMLVRRASAALAARFIAQTLKREGIEPGQLIVHADRGGEMTAQPVCALLDAVGVGRSHSRPQVSDDNPYSESRFKTLKYHRDFPDRFGSLEDARAYLREFFTWYNHEHRHFSIAMPPPAIVHAGQGQQRLEARHQIMRAAYIATPERFVRGESKPMAVGCDRAAG